MLLRFSVENFRSIREPIELQMTAVNYYKEASSQLLDVKLPGLSGMKFLRAAAIYGPNASGKTAIWRAFALMRGMVLFSAAHPVNEVLNYMPFQLDSESKHKPTRFFVTFTARDGVRYEYSFAYNATAFVEEKLLAYPKGFKQVWFTRTFTERGVDVKGSIYLKIPTAVKDLLNDNVLLLSLLANFSKVDAHGVVMPVVQWFSNCIDLYSRAPESANDFPHTGDIINGEIGTEYQRSFIQNMMRRADIGITSMRVEKRPIPESFKALMEKFPGFDSESNDEFKTVVFQHENAGNEMALEFGDESDGTKQLFGMSGHVAEALENGSLLFVDEIDASLHPVLVIELIRTFLNPESNPNGAQLIFTAHNPCLLENDLLRRDQIWLTEKNASSVTEFYPLSDYSPRKDESIMTGYLTGRFSAIPVVPACFGRCGVCAEG